MVGGLRSEVMVCMCLYVNTSYMRDCMCVCMCVPACLCLCVCGWSVCVCVCVCVSGVKKGT